MTQFHRYPSRLRPRCLPVWSDRRPKFKLLQTHLGWGLAAVGLLAIAAPASAQLLPIAPDQTLPTASIVTATPTGDQLTITGGTQAQRNLFHSFTRFSVLSGQTARFVTDPTINTVIARVTGSLPSAIDGVIQSTSNVNLFLLNPNGISFGSNAQLQIGGSLLASTAPGLRFADGTHLTTDPTTPPLLTVSVPVGIQWGARPAAALQNQANLVSAGNLSLFGGSLTGSGSLAAAGQVTVQAIAGNIQTSTIAAGQGAALQAAGDITVNHYTGGSLQVLAGGAVTMPGTIWVDRPGLLPSSEPAVPLSDGSLLTFASGRPKIDIRAGVALGAPFLPTGGSSDITLGTVGAVAASAVLVTNQFQPNPALAGGTIRVAAVGSYAPTSAGGDIAIDARRDLQLDGPLVMNHPLATLLGQPFRLLTIAQNGDSGAIRLLAQNNLSASGPIMTSSIAPAGRGGDVGLRSQQGEINLDQAAIVTGTVTAGDAGNVELTAPKINLLNGTLIVSGTGNNTTGNAGQITLNTAELTMAGTDAKGVGSRILSPTLGSGHGGDITVTTQTLAMRDRAQLISSTGGSGNAGKITVVSRDWLDIAGPGSGMFTQAGLNSGAGGTIAITSERIRLSDYAQLNADTLGNQSGGNILIDSGSFTATSGAKLSTITFGVGDGGNIQVTARDRLDLIGFGTIDPQIAALLGAIKLGNEITLESGSSGSTSAVVVTGPAGTLRLQAADLIHLAQTYTGLDTSSYGSGNSGTITLNSPLVNLTQAAYVSVSSWATGNAGHFTANADRLTVQDLTIYGLTVLGKGATLNLNANQVYLNNGALFTATLAGQGGNINLQVADRLILRNGSNIIARAITASSGGNINFQGGFIVTKARENNDIVATALQGQGGNIRINAKAIFGFQRRETRTDLSDISASSDFGVDGIVAIDAPQTNPNPNSPELSTTLVDPARQIAETCSSRTRASSFVVTGRGGLPPTPREVLNTPPGWVDRRADNPPAAGQPADGKPLPTASSTASLPLVEATHWVVNPDGSIDLVAPVAVIAAGTPAIACQPAPLVLAP